jgi:hypothetical protein
VHEATGADVVRAGDIDPGGIRALAQRYGIGVDTLDGRAPIRMSFWGEPEAGISSAGLQFRRDTPVHSVLHEFCHVVCMSASRRAAFERNAGGSVAEECAVCYLQILLADHLAGYSAKRCLADMDSWGYSFREGSAAAWFAGDGRDARQWLMAHDLIDAAGCPTWRLRS